MFSGSHIAFVFPPFASDYSDHPANGIATISANFRALLTEAASVGYPELLPFDFEGNNHLQDERRTQLITYIYSCAASVSLRQSGIKPAGVAGYSMGIYAACFDAGVYGFSDGLNLIDAAYRTISGLTRGRGYGMATIIGLNKEDILAITGRERRSISITNQNGPHAFVVSGIMEEVTDVIDLARNEGALHVRQLNVNTPYHAAFLQPAATAFESVVNGIQMAPPSTRLYSLINRSSLPDTTAIRNELVANLCQPLNWYNTMQTMMDDGFDLFIECGPSRGLTKNARFTEGNFRFLTLDKLNLH